MAYDLWSKQTGGRDWSMGTDLPKSAKGYAPNSFWKPEQMEAKLTEIMSKPKGLFSGKPSREEAIPILASYMKANKIGPTDVAGSEIGAAIKVALKDKDVLLNKIDDVRYDVRAARRVFGGALFAVAGAITFSAISKTYNAKLKYGQKRA